MKKIILSLLILLTLVGCSKKEPEIVYDYSYFNYLDIQIAGCNGYGKLFVNVKDFDSTGFKSESDYISLKKLMPEILNNLYISKETNILNGDQITIGLNDAYIYSGSLNIDLSPKTFEINKLEEPKALDLFDKNNIVFYGLEGTNKIHYYYPVNSDIPKDVREYLKYDIEIDENTVNENKTIVKGKASVLDKLLNTDEKYSSTETYFLFNGYYPYTESEFILKKVVKEKDLESANSNDVKKEFEDRLTELGNVNNYEFKQLINIQDTKNPFEYYLICEYAKEDKLNYVKYRVEMSYINGKLEVYNIVREGSCDKNYLNEGYSKLFDYESVEIIFETEEEIETE